MKMPTIFVGHGSPLNAIEVNRYTEKWKELGEKFKPRAILMISAHWFTDETRIQSENFPQKINDMYGFPKKLYDLEYQVQGDKELTESMKQLFENNLIVDDTWGIDHGAWSVLVQMYPNADIPVVQLSVDSLKSPKEHFELGKKISKLREKGIMIVGSGNVVHNLRKININMEDGYVWAKYFDNEIKSAIEKKNYDACINYITFGKAASQSVPTTDHYNPLLYVLGASNEADRLTIFNDGYQYGAISMTSYLFET